MKIRKAELEDYAQIMSLFNQFVGSDRYSKNDNDSFGKVLRSSNNYVFVAQDNDSLIGFVTFSVRNVIRYPKPIAELDELFVSPKYRKIGLGRQLVKKTEQLAKELNCYRVYVESHYDHKEAHKFYETLGYKNYGFHFIKNL